MADHSAFSTAGRTPSAQMDAGLSTLHAPEALPRLWTKVVGECVSAARSTSFGLRLVSTRTTSAWQFVERPVLVQSGVRATPTRSQLGFERKKLGSLRLRINQDARVEHALRI